MNLIKKIAKKITKTVKTVVNKIKSIVRKKETTSAIMEVVGTVAGMGASIMTAIVLKPYVKAAGMKSYQEAAAYVGIFFMSSALSRVVKREARVYYNEILDIFNMGEYAIQEVRVVA